MDALFDEARALLLLIAANAVPVVIAKLTRERWSAPLDFGYVMPDGERLFGSHKTWRGLVSGVLACLLVGALLGVSWQIAAGFALVSLLADALSSAIKRRLRLLPGAEYVGLDQLGEAALPLIVFARPLSLELKEMLVVAATFIVLDIATARLRHRSWLS